MPNKSVTVMLYKQAYTKCSTIIALCAIWTMYVLINTETHWRKFYTSLAILTS
jgi:hypothetical protein